MLTKQLIDADGTAGIGTLKITCETVGEEAKITIQDDGISLLYLLAAGCYKHSV